MTTYQRIQSARAFGLALKAARIRRGLSQEDLAERGDFDRTYPSMLERGRRSPTFWDLAARCGFHRNYVSNVEQARINITLGNLEALAGGLECGEEELILPHLR